MKKVLFIDRDGTLVYEPDDFQIDSFAKLKLLPGVINSLTKIVRETDYELVMVSNQDGLGTASFPEREFFAVHDHLMQIFSGEGINFAAVCIDRSFESENKSTRKPNTGMLTKYLTGEYDLSSSYVIGDRQTDVQLAKNLGSGSIFIKNTNFPAPEDATIVAENWQDIYEFLTKPTRRAEVIRKTNETNIEIMVDLDGTGRADIATGIAFFDHMLEQLAKHGSIDLQINARGDLHIDEHHTIEDVAITLGQAFDKALGDKRGLQRYGFLLPMDDCLAQVALDFGGRSWTVWDAEFKREMIGEMPTEMFFHFFRSFSDSAKCNLNIKAEGTNEHHKIESIFKAFARAIKMAVARDLVDQSLPTTKGSL